MRRLFVLSVLLAGVVWIHLFELDSAQASAFCSVTCPNGVVLTCCLSTGSCTSVQGTSINCNGALMSCSHEACVNNCALNYESCLGGCFGRSCRLCEVGFDACLSQCGQTNIGC